MGGSKRARGLGSEGCHRGHGREGGGFNRDRAVTMGRQRQWVERTEGEGGERAELRAVMGRL